MEDFLKAIAREYDISIDSLLLSLKNYKKSNPNFDKAQSKKSPAKKSNDELEPLESYTPGNIKKLTVPTLKALLTSNGVEFKSKMKKADLVELAIAALDGADDIKDKSPGKVAKSPAKEDKSPAKEGKSPEKAGKDAHDVKKLNKLKVDALREIAVESGVESSKAKKMKKQELLDYLVSGNMPAKGSPKKSPKREKADADYLFAEKVEVPGYGSVSYLQNVGLYVLDSGDVFAMTGPDGNIKIITSEAEKADVLKLGNFPVAIQPVQEEQIEDPEVRDDDPEVDEAAEVSDSDDDSESEAEDEPIEESDAEEPAEDSDDEVDEDLEEEACEASDSDSDED